MSFLIFVQFACANISSLENMFIFSQDGWPQSEGGRTWNIPTHVATVINVDALLVKCLWSWPSSEPALSQHHLLVFVLVQNTHGWWHQEYFVCSQPKYYASSSQRPLCWRLQWSMAYCDISKASYLNFYSVLFASCTKCRLAHLVINEIFIQIEVVPLNFGKSLYTHSSIIRQNCHLNSFSAGTDFTSKSDVYRCQILTFKVDPHTERIKKMPHIHNIGIQMKRKELTDTFIWWFQIEKNPVWSP